MEEPGDEGLSADLKRLLGDDSIIKVFGKLPRCLNVHLFTPFSLSSSRCFSGVMKTSRHLEILRCVLRIYRPRFKLRVVFGVAVGLKTTHPLSWTWLHSSSAKMGPPFAERTKASGTNFGACLLEAGCRRPCVTMPLETHGLLYTPGTVFKRERKEVPGSG